MAAQFRASLPPSWSVVDGTWAFFDVAQCHLNDTYCYGNNPSSPYGYPDFGSGFPMRIGVSDAVVVFMRTPPAVRYFGFTQYLNRRGTAEPVLASLSDTLNHLRFVSLQSPTPGQDVFDRLAVLVWTADLRTLATARDTLQAQGIPTANVNVLPLPVGLPLNMGTAEGDDSFTLLLRAAVPDSQVQLDQYVAERPFAVLRIVPTAPPPPDPAPTLGFVDETSGVAEDPVLAVALNELVADIKAKYRRRFAFKAQAVRNLSAKGFDCIAQSVSCNFDNHDALYSNDLTTRSIVVKNLQDVVIVAGVNHQRAGKAVYLNHSVSDPSKSTGIVAVEDALLTPQSALYHANVRRADDPRVERYRHLYAYAVSYDCNGLEHCLGIPAPTPSDPIGLPPGAAFSLWERTYVDPATGVRPSTAEIVRQQVLVGTLR